MNRSDSVDSATSLLSSTESPAKQPSKPQQQHQHHHPHQHQHQHQLSQGASSSSPLPVDATEMSRLGPSASNDSSSSSPSSPVPTATTTSTSTSTTASSSGGHGSGGDATSSASQHPRSQQLYEEHKAKRQQQQQQQQQQQRPVSSNSAAPQARRTPASPDAAAPAQQQARNGAAEAANNPAEEEEYDEEEELKYGAESVMALIVPVTLCMAIVVATIQSVTYYATSNGDYLYYVAFKEDTDSSSEKFGGAIVNALIIVGIILVMTCVLVVLYKYRCYKAIWGWLFLSTIMLLFLFTFIYFQLVLERYNVAMDWMTFFFVIWNFGVVGVVAIHWKAPLLLTQAYLIVTSALLALTLIKHLPEWTTWVLLAAIAIYDLFAVLCPSGPLKVLVETAAERQEPIFPALIYSSTMAWIAVATNPTDEDDENESAIPPSRMDPEAAPRQQSAAQGQARRPAPARQAPATATTPAASNARESEANVNTVEEPDAASPANAQADDDEHGVKLGLGDFIFYSVLVGKAATSNNWSIILACFFAILVGLCLTLLLLAIYKRALPALPISIAFGLIFYFVSNEVLVPFVEQMASVQVFV